MTYTNLPPYEPALGTTIPKPARFAFATNVLGQGAVVEKVNTFRHVEQARRARANARRRGEWVSHLLERVGKDEWVPVEPRIRKRYAITLSLTLANC